MARRRPEADAASAPGPERPRAGLLLDDLAAQLARFRLLPGGSDADAERVLAGLTPASPREREATKELADRQILAHPDRFEDAHHLVIKALEVFDRHGWRGPKLPHWLGPLRSLAQIGRRAGHAHHRALVRARRGQLDAAPLRAARGAVRVRPARAPACSRALASR